MNVSGGVNLLCVTIVFAGLLVDMVWKSFSMAKWYVNLITATYLLIQISLLNYEVKRVLTAALTNDSSNYQDRTFCSLTSFHFQVLV